MIAGDLTTARYLDAALRRHRAHVERNGGAVPAELRFLERLVTFGATAGHPGTSSGTPPMAPDDHGVTPRLLTYRQVGDALACSERTIKRLVAAGALPSVRVGGAVRIRLTDLDGYVDQLGATTTTPEGPDAA